MQKVYGSWSEPKNKSKENKGEKLRWNIQLLHMRATLPGSEIKNQKKRRPPSIKKRSTPTAEEPSSG